MPGRRGKQLLGLAAGVLAVAGGAYLLLGQTRVDVAAGEGAEAREVACGNAFAGGRRAEVSSTTASAPTTPPTTGNPATTAAPTTAPATTAAPDAEAVPAEAGVSPDEAAAAAAEDAAVEDCSSAKRPRTIAGGVLLAVGLGAVVILTQLLDTADFADD